jgi:hypothetical protein
MGYDPSSRSALVKDGVGEHPGRPVNEVEEDDGCRSEIETGCIPIFELREVGNARGNGVAPRLLHPIWRDIDTETSGASRGSRGDCQTAVTAPKVVDNVPRLDVGKTDHALDDFGGRRNIRSEYVTGRHDDGS